MKNQNKQNQRYSVQSKLYFFSVLWKKGTNQNGQYDNNIKITSYENNQRDNGGDWIQLQTFSTAMSPK